MSEHGTSSERVTVRPVRSMLDRHRFIQLPHSIYEDDPNYHPPLDVMEWDSILPSRNPWFDHGDAQLFLAERGDEIVGRISAQVDHKHLDVHDDGAGFFGWFEVEEDPEAAEQLLDVAEDWCRTRGMDRIRGPYSFSLNEKCGLLVDGFEYPNYVMMPHGRPYYQELVEEAGYEKAKDLYAWLYERGELPDHVKQMMGTTGDDDIDGLEIRTIDTDNIERDVENIMEIFNEAWADNWGFVPFTAAEVQQVADQFKLIVDEDLCMIAEYEGEAIAMAVALPNINEAFRDLDGKLLPFGWAKALYRLKVDPVKTFRLILLGIKEKYRGTALGGLSVELYTKIHERAYEAGYEQAEASWTLEDNEGINQGMEFMGAEQYKTYRVYEKEL